MHLLITLEANVWVEVLVAITLRTSEEASRLTSNGPTSTLKLALFPKCSSRAAREVGRSQVMFESPDNEWSTTFRFLDLLARRSKKSSDNNGTINIRFSALPFGSKIAV